MERHSAGKKFFAKERAEHFNRKVRAAAVDEQRRAKDSETRRMEEYRKLCKREGIESQRLAAYDARKENFRKQTDEALEAIANDVSLTSTEKRKRQFAVKRKVSTTSMMADPKTTGFGKMKAAQERQAEARQQAQDLRAEREAARQEKRRDRSRRNQLYATRTSKGQPHMASRVQDLLRRIEK